MVAFISSSMIAQDRQESSCGSCRLLWQQVNDNSGFCIAFLIALVVVCTEAWCPEDQSGEGSENSEADRFRAVAEFLQVAIIFGLAGWGKVSAFVDRIGVVM